MLTVILGVILGGLLYYKLFRPTQYWLDRKIPHVPAWPIIGSMWGCVTRKKHFLEVSKEIYEKFPNDRYVGYNHFNSPTLLIRDLDLIKQIGVKEFESFHDHLNFADYEVDPLFSKSLLNLIGNKWKQMRAILSPAFTSSKMKHMYHFMVECSENFANHFKGKETDVEMKDLFGRFASDVIASTAFGISVNAMEDPNHEFYTKIRKLTQFGPLVLLKVLLFQISMRLTKVLKMRMMPQELADFFTSIIKSNIKKRQEEGIVRLDLIHLLLEARKGKLKHEDQKEKVEGFATVEEYHTGKKTEHMELTDDHIVAQSLLFYLAGFETVSNALSLLAHELAVNPDIQKKLQEEIDSVREKHQDKVPYEALVSMKYLDQVICEILRMWPPAFQTDRFCNKSYTVLPKSSRERTFVIEKGILTSIPIMAIHRDPQYFPEPDRFNPDRFTDENKSKIVPGSYMPFGIGPRNCIGSRFALLEMKTLCFHLLEKFDLVPNEKTEIPLKVSPKKVNVSPENGFHLRLKPRAQKTSG